MSSFKATIFIIFSGSFLISDVTSICCPKIEKIFYYPAPGAECYDIDGSYVYGDGGLCLFRTCADLIDHGVDFYCGKGDCNFFGCNCDDGCIQLDDWGTNQVSALEKVNKTVYLREIFLKKYGKLVKHLKLDDDEESLKLSSKIPIERDLKYSVL